MGCVCAFAFESNKCNLNYVYEVSFNIYIWFTCQEITQTGPYLHILFWSKAPHKQDISIYTLMNILIILTNSAVILAAYVNKICCLHPAWNVACVLALRIWEAVMDLTHTAAWYHNSVTMSKLSIGCMTELPVVFP